MPVEPPATAWVFPPLSELPPDHASDLVLAGADLEAGTLLAAYRAGYFPMPVDLGGGPTALGWWSPDPRGILPLDGLRVTRSMRRSARRFDIRWNTAFAEVIAACADEGRTHGWITPEIAAAYRTLHSLGWAHSVEAWAVDDGALAGGLYGVAIGGLFAGESMFHFRTDASKVALIALVDTLREGGGVLLDVQWTTAHLARLGAVDVPRARYAELVAAAVASPLPSAFAFG